MKSKSNIKAGSRSWQHNQSGVAVKTRLKSGYHAQQHNQTASPR